MSQSFEYWLELVSGAVMASAEDRQEIAIRCYQKDLENNCGGVWHEASEYFGTECPCYPCTKERERKAKQRKRLLKDRA